MDSTKEEDLQNYTVQQLKAELRSRYLPTTGNKDELVVRLHQDNVSKEEHGILDDYKRERTKRLSQEVELKSLQMQLNQLKQDDGNRSNAGTSESDGTLVQILHTQSMILQQITSPAQQTLQVYSTTDTSQAIPLFGGNRSESSTDWIRQVERIAKLANWSDNLSLVNAATRLRGPAGDWHKAIGKNLLDWQEWKAKLCERFSLKMSFAEFITFQAKRTLRSTETITEYIYSKNALFTKSPCTIPEADKVSLILEGIWDSRWSIPLASHCCKDVEGLLLHAAALDNIRKVMPRDKFNRSETVSTNVAAENQKYNKFIPKFNPQVDRKEDQFCYRCRMKGHVSYDCKVPSKISTNPEISNSRSNNAKFEPKYNKPQPSISTSRNFNNTNQINCVQEEGPHVTLIPVTINGCLKLNALPDSGSIITIVDKDVLPQETEVYPWTKGDYKVAGNVLTPIGWITARIEHSPNQKLPLHVVCQMISVCHSY